MPNKIKIKTYFYRNLFIPRRVHGWSTIISFVINIPTCYRPAHFVHLVHAPFGRPLALFVFTFRCHCGLDDLKAPPTVQLFAYRFNYCHSPLFHLRLPSPVLSPRKWQAAGSPSSFLLLAACWARSFIYIYARGLFSFR